MQGREQLGLPRQDAIAANPVDRAIARRRDEPAGRIARPAVARPPLERRRDCVLESVLGQLEIAEDADQGGEDAAALLAEDAGELVYAPAPDMSITGLTSIEPSFADGILAAQSSASSSASTSIT